MENPDNPKRDVTLFVTSADGSGDDGALVQTHCKKLPILKRRQSPALLKRMSIPDYSAQGWQNILVSLDGPVAILKLNRAKQYAPHHSVLLLATNLTFCNSDATRLRSQSRRSWSLPTISLTEMIASVLLCSRLIPLLMPSALE